MFRTLPVLALFVAALPLALAADQGAAEDRMLEAFLDGRRDDVARAGRDLRANGLAPVLVSPHRPSALAAVAASPAAGDGWELLVPLADLATGPDRPIAAGAARAAVAIAVDLDRDQAMLQEIPTAHLKERMALWQRLAADRTRWADVRVHALEVAEHIRRSLPPGEPPTVAFPVAATLADPDPEVRRAALELIPTPVPEEVLEEVAALVVQDADELVALVAAQVLCGGLAFGDRPGPILESAGEEGLARIRTLITREPLPPLARIEAGRCLAAAGKGELAPVRALVSSVPAHLRGEAQELLAGMR